MRRSTKESTELSSRKSRVLATCPICESPLRAAIEKHDSVWKDPETVKWARGKGLNISRLALIKHRINHLQPPVSDGNGNNRNNDNKNDQALEAKAFGINNDIPLSGITAEIPIEINGDGKKLSKRCSKIEKPLIQPAANDVVNVAPAKAPVMVSTEITDHLLLDTVRDRVYQKLLNGEIELDLADGFKAIEIKHKVADQSQNEKLLLEILNEIRSQELKGVMASHDTQ